MPQLINEFMGGDSILSKSYRMKLKKEKFKKSYIAEIIQNYLKHKMHHLFRQMKDFCLLKL